MQLPTSEGGKLRSLQHSSFPHSFPAHYLQILSLKADVKKVALNKMAKIIYFLTVIREENELPASSLVSAELISVTPPNLMLQSEIVIRGFNSPTELRVKSVSVQIVLFFQSIRSFFYPSNTGAWTAQLAYFIATFVFQICRHIGKSIAANILSCEGDANAFELPLHYSTIEYLCGSLLSLIVEGLYSKDQVMAHLCQSCIKNLVTVNHKIGELLMPLLMSALDPAAVNLSHQGMILNFFLFRLLLMY
jgi:hypothetical protein